MRRHLAGAIFMVFGTLGLLYLLSVMNQPPPKKEAPKARASVAMDIAPKSPKRKPKRKPKPKPKPKPKQVNRRPPAPAPKLATALSGVNVGLNLGGGAGFSNAAESLMKASDAVSDMVMNEGSVDQAPKANYAPAPRYPPRAYADQIEGTVVFSLLIDATGRVTKADIVRSEPPGVFDEAARRAIMRWQFSPATYQGKPTKYKGNKTIKFRIK